MKSIIKSRELWIRIDFIARTSLFIKGVRAIFYILFFMGRIRVSRGNTT